MSQEKVAHHSATLKRMVRRTLGFGCAAVVVGAASIAGAWWWGLDYTGMLMLGVGILLGGIGIALIALGVGCAVVLAEGWVRGRREPSRRRDRNLARAATTASGPAPQPVQKPPEPRPLQAGKDGAKGPLIF